tara:strand:- start:14 stop:760 length:747 start_codon:yes stop_codon:yes gene_type:complete
MWRKVIPSLLKDFTVVSADLRGYGDSSKPKPDKRHHAYSKREMAKDQILLMKKLGFEKFFAIGHDRGARVFHRAALDYPNSIKKLILIDIVPTVHIYNNLNKDIAENFFHWFFLSQKSPVPENIITKNKEFYVKAMLGRLSNITDFMDKKTLNEYLKKFTNEVIISSCEDYRAGASIDIEHHNKDKEKISCPTLILWGKSSLVGKNFMPLEVWNNYCIKLEGFGLKGGHYLPEENPKSVTSKIFNFLN